MANGFLAASPGARHGDSDPGTVAGWLYAQRFTCPGAGAQDISEIGFYAKDNNNEMRFAIFTDDLGNTCPESIVANSESATVTTTANIAKVSHTYGTKPQLTGGVDYWLVSFHNAAINVDFLASAGENTISVTGYTAYTWPDAADWHTHTDRSTSDMSLYAVYAAAGAIVTLTKATLILTGKDVAANRINPLVNVSASLTGKDIALNKANVLSNVAVTLTGKSIVANRINVLTNVAINLVGKVVNTNKVSSLANVAMTLTGKTFTPAVLGAVILVKVVLTMIGKVLAANKTYAMGTVAATITGKILFTRKISSLIKATLVFVGKSAVANKINKLTKVALIFTGKTFDILGEQWSRAAYRFFDFF